MGSQFLRKLPKVELHAHLNGSLSIEILRNLSEMRKKSKLQSVEVPDPQELLASGFDEAFGLFKVIQQLTDHPDMVYEATKMCLEEFAAENVKYMELRSTPRSIIGGMSRDDYVHAILRAIRDVNQNECVDIFAKYLISVDRRLGIGEAWRALELNLKYRPSFPGILAGLEISGDARHGSLQDYRDFCKTARNNGCKVSIHLAEVPNHEEVQVVLEQFQPDRIGHGTAIHPSTGGSESLWRLLKSTNVPVEVCLTSNVLCKSVPNYNDHHVKYLEKENHPYSICTDDKGIFFSDLSNEFKIAQEIMKLDDRSMFDISLKSIEHIFASEELKSKLREKFRSFEAEHF